MGWPARQLVAVAAVTVCGCGGGGAGVDETIVDIDTARLNFARAVYGVDPSTPPEFHAEPDPYPDRLTLRYHVLDSEAGGGGLFEACAADSDAALGYSDASATARGYSTTLTATASNDWYFQFDRNVQSVEPTMLINRVFRCDAIDRSSATAASAGHITRRPVTAEDVRFVAEYLWTIGASGNALNAVTDSSARGADSHRLRAVRGERLAGQDGCDLIEVWDEFLSVDATTGELTRSEQFVDAFQSRYESGIVSLCQD